MAIILRRDVMVRSLRVAVLVGTILVIINYGDKILGARLTRTDIVKIILTYCVPYCVSTYASVLAVIEERRANQ
jgi:hypothetical protein